MPCHSYPGWLSTHAVPQVPLLTITTCRATGTPVDYQHMPCYRYPSWLSTHDVPQISYWLSTYAVPQVPQLTSYCMCLRETILFSIAKILSYWELPIQGEITANLPKYYRKDAPACGTVKSYYCRPENNQILLLDEVTVGGVVGERWLGLGWGSVKSPTRYYLSDWSSIFCSSISLYVGSAILIRKGYIV